VTPLYTKGKTHFSYLVVMHVSRKGKEQILLLTVVHSWLTAAGVGFVVVTIFVVVVVSTLVVVDVFASVVVGGLVGAGVIGRVVGLGVGDGGR